MTSTTLCNSLMLVPWVDTGAFGSCRFLQPDAMLKKHRYTISSTIVRVISMIIAIVTSIIVFEKFDVKQCFTHVMSINVC